MCSRSVAGENVFVCVNGRSVSFKSLINVNGRSVGCENFCLRMKGCKSEDFIVNGRSIFIPFGIQLI